MNEDMSDLMNKLNSMLGSNSNNNLKDIFNNFSENNSSKSSASKSTTDSDDSNDFNMDFDTIMKMKSIMDAMNSKKNDPRSKLLLSLKPYLKDSRKQKLDQYIGLLNMSSVFELFKENGGDLNSKSK